MVFPNNRIINKSSTNNSNNNSNNKLNSVYSLQYPKNEEERWIVKQIKLLYSKLLIAHFNILKINANQRKELYEELLVKYKNFFGKDFIPEKEEESNTFSFNNENQNNLNSNIVKEQQLDKEIKRITIKNSIQSYVEDSSDEEDKECQNTNPIIPSTHSEKELTEKELRKLLGIEVSNDSTSKSNPNNFNDAPPPYSEYTDANNSFDNNPFANNPFINNEDIIAKEA